MCWTAPVSVGMVAIGAVATVVAVRRRETPAIPVTFAYFTLMEGLQALTYPVLDQCGSPSNQALTLLSYLHITFQPFFVNAFAMALVGEVVSRRMRTGAYLACGASAIVMLLQVYPFSWAEACRDGTAMCGVGLCSISGDWHLGWTVPYNNLVPPLAVDGFTLAFPTYFFAAFFVPLLYGAWRLVVFHALFGPVMARVLTTNVNEMPAIWCLFSIAIIVAALSPWIRQRLAVPDAAVPRLA